MLNLYQISISSTFAMKALLLILSSLFLIIYARQPYPFRHRQMEPLKTKTQFFKSIKSDLMAFFNSIKSIFNTTKEPLRKHYNKHFVSHMLRTIRHHREKYKFGNLRYLPKHNQFIIIITISCTSCFLWVFWFGVEFSTDEKDHENDKD